MRDYGLGFIESGDLYRHVKETVEKYRFQIDLVKLNQNFIDPIKLTFDAGIYHRSFSNDALESVLEKEVWRQMDKSNTNHIGYFHQNIFRYVGRNNSWTVPKQGFDIENQARKIFVEMKNKHNTMNSSSSAKTYMRMQNKILQDPENKCFLVEVIARRSQDIEWVCSIDNQSMHHNHIRRISIDKFYEIVTGDENAFSNLCSILPNVINDVVAAQTRELIEDTVLEDLRRQATGDILKDLYLLTFRRYQGFERFDWVR